MPSPHTLKTLLPERWRRRLREAQVALSIAHVHGPRVVQAGPCEGVVTCLVKNGEFYLDEFVDHYFSLGFRHICLLDNDSTDGTVARAATYRHVTIYRSPIGILGRQDLLKKRLAHRAVRGGWCLDVDIDELFDYPYSDVLPLPRFLAYLNQHGYTAVLTQMLDMFSERPLSWLAANGHERLKEVHRYYDLSDVSSVAYRDDPLTLAHGSRNRIASTRTMLLRGGIRRTVYGINPVLTKHSLFKAGADLDLFPHPHYVNNANLADVSGVLLHYKFASNAIADALQNQEAFKANSDGYRRMVDTIRTRPDATIKGPAARVFRGAASLLDEGFLFASDDYRSWALSARTPEAA